MERREGEKKERKGRREGEKRKGREVGSGKEGGRKEEREGSREWKGGNTVISDVNSKLDSLLGIFTLLSFLL